MKDVIVVVEKDRKNEGLLATKNADKTAMAKVSKISSAINLGNKYSYVISNTDIDATGDLGLTDIQKY